MQHSSTTPESSVAAKYRRILRGATAAGGGLESAPPAELSAELSADSIRDRQAVARDELRKLIARYMNNSADARALAERIVRQGGEGLHMVADRDDEALANAPAAVQGLEAIVRTDGSRPSFLIVNDEIDRQSSPLGDWGPRLSVDEENLRGLVRRVGRIDVPGSTVGFTGTGFLIHDNLILTNRHVLQLSAAPGNGGTWTFFDGAAIDFGHELGGVAGANRRRLKRAVFYGDKPIVFDNIDHGKLDLALIELEPSSSFVPPTFNLALDLAPAGIGLNANIYTIGYPGSPPQFTYTPTLIEQLFASQFGYKRLAPGTVIPSEVSTNPWTIAHDATTLGGNSGSLVIRSGVEGLAVGLHYGGRSSAPRENWAHRLALALDQRDGQSQKTLREVLASFGINLAAAGQAEGGAPLPVPTKPAPPETPAPPPESTPDPKLDRLRNQYRAHAERLRHRPRWEAVRETPAATALIEKPDGVDEFFRRAEETAAISGRFHPDNLLDWGADDARKVAVLSRLAPNCQVETFAGELQWQLTSRRRTEILRGFEVDQSLADRLKPQNAESLPPTDRFGELLREVLRDGKASSLDQRSRDDLVLLGAVADVVQDLNLPNFKADEIRTQLARGNFLQEYGVLLDEGFFGRDDELRALRKFLTDPPAAGTTYGSLVLTGEGGAGKSTLIGKFAHNLFQEKLATIVVLDLDRPGIDVADPDWLSLEIARQVGRQYPESMEMLRTSRRHTRYESAETRETELHSGSESVSLRRSQSGSILSDVRHALQLAGALVRPLLLIFDTFELAVRNLVDVSSLEEWLPELASILGPAPLRVIYSGRPFNVRILKQPPVSLPLDELPPEMAEQLLLRQKLSPVLSDRLANSRVFPRRPLELKLLARALRGESDASIRSLEDELRGASQALPPPAGASGAKVRELLKTGLIYRRVLNRIDDPIARRLAFPGLVLRYVSLELIREVLSPVLELDLTADDARHVLQELTPHSWLVEMRQEGEYWHRGDLRRLMMQLLSGQEAEQADKISRRAIEFFRGRRAPGDEVEVAYHRLRLVKKPADGDQIELSDIGGEIASALVANEADFSPTAGALLKLTRNEHVPLEDVVSMPRRYLPLAYDRSGSNLVEAGEYGTALKLYRRGLQDDIPVNWGGDWPTWQMETLFQTAGWQELRFWLPRRPVSRTEKFANQLFPGELIGQSDMTAARIEKVFSQFPRTGFDGEKDNGTQVGRVVMSLLLLNRRDRLSSKSWNDAFEIAREVAGEKHRSFSAFLDGRIRLLRLATGFDEPLEVRLAPSTLSLDPRWLAKIAKRIRPGSAELARLVSEVGEAVNQVAQAGRPTARRILAAADGLYRERKTWRDAILELPRGDKRIPYLLRGPDVEFRAPCRFALIEAYTTRDDRLRLARRIASLVPFQLDDLQPEMFADLLAADPERGLEPHLELVDRVWALGKLMKLAVKDKPNAEKLQDVFAAYGRWDAAVVEALKKSSDKNRPAS